jgi:DNA helicase II / ATP-dependent DNA helicase PcrA
MAQASRRRARRKRGRGVIVEKHATACAPVQSDVSRSEVPLYARTDGGDPVCASMHSPSRVFKKIRAKVTLGPPGTGKTTRAIEVVLDLIRRGVPAAAIAFVTFTRAAWREVLARLHRDARVEAEALHWFRTIHSTAFRLQRLARGVIMDDADWKRFGDQCGYEFTSTRALDLGDGPAVMPESTRGDELRFFHFWARNQILTTSEAIARTRLNHLRPRDIDAFTRHFRLFKQEKQLLDFCDILERAREADARPPIDVALIDEAQDLSPLQISLVEKWFEPCTEIHVFGDDDQTIYGFNGATPEWLRHLATTCPCEILKHSHRVPRIAHHLANLIICRNRARVPKEYLPRGVEGQVVHLPTAKALALIDGSVKTVVLARNRMFLRPFAEGLIRRRLPFIVEGGGADCPMARPGPVAAVKAVAAIRRAATGDAPIAIADLCAILELMNSRGNPLLPQGVKARAEAMTGAVRPSDLGLSELWERIRSDQHLETLTKLKPAHRAYFAALLGAHGEVPEARIFLTSIHGAKGRGAPLVVVIPDMTRETHRRYAAGTRAEAEAENRVFYVAVTRTEQRLVLVDPKTDRHYRFPRIQFEQGEL